MPAPHHSVFYRPDALLSPNQQRQSTEGTILHIPPVVILSMLSILNKPDLNVWNYCFAKGQYFSENTAFEYQLYLYAIYSTNTLPSVLWRCWLGGRKGIQPVKKLSGGVLAWHSGARCRLAYGPADATHSLSLASVKSRLGLLFWYQLTWVVPEKGPLNRCVWVYMYIQY